MADSITCLTHPERATAQHECASAVRDGVPGQVCVCCDACRAACLLIPHGHGGTPAEEWDGARCRVCGEDVSRWLGGGG